MEPVDTALLELHSVHGAADAELVGKEFLFFLDF